MRFLITFSNDESVILDNPTIDKIEQVQKLIDDTYKEWIKIKNNIYNKNQIVSIKEYFGDEEF